MDAGASASAQRGQTDAIAFIVPEAASKVFSEDAFFTRAIQGVSEELARAGKHLILMLAPTQEDYQRVEAFVTSGHVDGVIVASMHGIDSLPSALLKARVPLVATGRPLGTQAVPYVDIEHRKAVREAVLMVLDSGRENVVYIAGPQDMYSGVERLAGYTDAMEERGLPVLVTHGEYTRESGSQAMHELLIRGTPFDAVVAASDLMALGAMHLLTRGGLRVPQDVSVVGFDDIDAARYADPPLTTVRQPAQGLGAAAARQVLRLASGEEVEEELLLPTELILRRSV